jgi:hypothetical protein
MRPHFGTANFKHAFEIDKSGKTACAKRSYRHSAAAILQRAGLQIAPAAC